MIGSLTAKKRRFHGWKILALSTFSQFVALGCTLYLLGIYIEPLATAYGATPGRIGSASAVFVVAGAALGPILGYWSDKGQVRTIMLLGSLALPTGFVLLSQSVSLPQAALICFFLIAPGSAMLGAIPTTVMVAQWFEKRRGLAIGITAAGMSTGGFIMPPLAAWLMEAFGWRESLLILGSLIAFILVPATWWIAIHKPADIGQYPDGVDTAPIAADTEATENPALNLKQILVRWDFWIISFAIGVISFFGILIVTYLAPFAQERGLSLQTSALLVSLYSVSGIGGKFFLGWLCDRLPPHRLIVAVLAVAAIGWLPILSFPHVAAFALTATAVGFAMGGLLPVWASLIALNFGLHSFGRVRGIMSLVLITATAMPGPLGGYIYDTTGSYATAFSMLWALLPAGAIVALFIPVPKRSVHNSRDADKSL